ncbi:ABC transporter permease [Pullulanibacillus sp. KACC 23026]|uniref:ABC transporter permease n=1 Tax=Pullulanibacillus sp. KACC 23026 TaxID=3028315 RepID=UPI0023B090D8|nr:ABC transporter permease [Pullulanibacillus sp. KACC 23026]WEG11925.1 ABC transporter permease [Pullulanibacillus sp. KACC 23026]
MIRYIAGRIGYLIVTLIIIAAITFLMMELLPGSPFNSQKLTTEQIAILKHNYHLDDPIPVQFMTYMGNMLHGDLGVSFAQNGRPVTQILSTKIGPSALIGLEAVIVGSIIGLLLGIIAALKRNSWADYLSNFISVIGISIPSFVFAGLLQYWIGVKLQWLPIAFWGGPKYQIMPAFALAVGVIATIARFMRTEMLDVLGQDYIVTAKAKGMTSASVIFKHTIRNAMIPIITILGPLVVNIMTGSLVIENIFAIPGIGAEFVDCITQRDYPMIMGTTLMYTLLFLVVVLVVDLLYGVIDPRIRLGGGRSE